MDQALFCHALAGFSFVEEIDHALLQYTGSNAPTSVMLGSWK
jgi:hypothetical protein